MLAPPTQLVRLSSYQSCGSLYDAAVCTITSGLKLRDQALDQCAVGDAADGQVEMFMRRQVLAPPGGKIVNTHYPIATREQQLDDVRADLTASRQ